MRINKNIALGIIIGGVLFGGISVGANYLYKSNQISYKDKNVESSLNDLYDLSIKHDIIDLGQYSEGCTVDVSSYKGYEKFTKDNFFIDVVSNYINGYSYKSNDTMPASSTLTISKNYDPSTGIINISNAYASTGVYNAWYCSSSLTFKLYLVS